LDSLAACLELYSGCRHLHGSAGAVSIGRRLPGEGGTGSLGVIAGDPVIDAAFGLEAIRQVARVDRLVFERTPQPVLREP
jgi:hypothetical protein